MHLNSARLSSIRATLKYLVCITFLLVWNTATGLAGTRADAQVQCNNKLGPGAVAIEDFSFGETSYVCDCRKTYMWNESGSTCVRRQSDAPNTAGQQPPDDSREPPKYSDDDGPPPQAPPRVNEPRKNAKRVAPKQREKRTVRTKKKKRVVRGSAATARRYCRRRYGRRLVNVRVKRSKFYCHYYGKNSIGYNKRIKWKKFRFRNIR